MEGTSHGRSKIKEPLTRRQCLFLRYRILRCRRSIVRTFCMEISKGEKLYSFCRMRLPHGLSAAPKPKIRYACVSSLCGRVRKPPVWKRYLPGNELVAD